MSTVSDSDVESDGPEPEYPQLEYILEYVTSNKDLPLPAQSQHDLLSLVCEEPSQPRIVPPYLLVAGCRAVFTQELKDVFFEEAASALKQLDHLESIRSRYVRALRASTLPAAKNYPVEKVDRETLKMYYYTWVAMRRWTLIHEIETEPFTSMNCLAIINILYAPSQQYHEVPRERMAATTVLQKVKVYAARTRSVEGSEQLDAYKQSTPYERAFLAMSRYLEVTQQLIAHIEEIIAPMPSNLRAMGIKRTECAMQRIAKHLIQTSADGYRPDERGTQESTISTPQVNGNAKRKRITSPEI